MRGLRGHAKKAIAAICAVAMLAFGAPPAAVFAHWADEILERWQGYGILQGDENGDLNPDDPITRAEAAKLLAGLFDGAGGGGVSFSDVSAGDWHYTYVRKVAALGVMVGVGGGRFGPDERLSREQAATLLHRAFATRLSGAEDTGFNDLAQASDWALEGIGALAGAGVILGYADGGFHPADDVTRAEFLAMLDRLLPEDYAGGAITIGEEDVPRGVGDLQGDGDGDGDSGDGSGAGASGGGDDVVGGGDTSSGQPTTAAAATIGGSGTGGSGTGSRSDGGSTPTTTAPTTTAPTTTTPTTTTPPTTTETPTTTAPTTPAPPVVAAPTVVGQYSVQGVNYVMLAEPADSAAGGDDSGDGSGGGGGYAYALNGAAIPASDVLLNGDGSKIVKIEVPAGFAGGGTLAASYDGDDIASYALSFGAAGAEAPVAVYGTVPMAFSAFFHDVTSAAPVGDGPASTAFEEGAADPATPAKFITQGTRTGNAVGGVDTLTYVEGDALDKVDAISSATYGDAVHFLPNGNLDLVGDRNTNTDPESGATGISRVEVGVRYDLWANAALLRAAGLGTARSANVLAALSDFDETSRVYADGGIADATGAALPDLGVYKVKYLLEDGNWGARVDPADGAAAAAKPLPGDGTLAPDAEASYGGNWGDKVLGVAFGGTLQAEYSGASYWDNFAEYIYGGVITDENGHSEPLVFLQQIFSHRNHTDFDLAISPSRFARLQNLAPSGTYQVTMYAWGFADMEFEIALKDYVNASAALEGPASIVVGSPTTPNALEITGVERFDAASAGLAKGGAPVASADYALSYDNGAQKVTVALNASLWEGGYQGAYTVVLVDAADTASKAITFTLVNPVRPKLATNADLSGGANAGAGEGFTVSQSAGKLWFDVPDFGRTLVTSGRSGYSTIQNITDGGAAAAIGGAAARDSASDPYYIDLSALAVGKTYAIVAVSTGFQTQTYEITIAT